MAVSRFQQEVINEFLTKRRACVSIPMGSGKTLVALATTTRIGGGSSLIVVSPTLIDSWIHELTKFFGSGISYRVYHPSAPRGDAEADIVITTADLLGKRYKELGLKNYFQSTSYEDRGGPHPTAVNRYHVPDRPFLSPADEREGGFLYSTKWKCIVVDEVQTYVNALSARCQAIASVYARYRMALSGTPLSEPKAECLLGYHLVLGVKTFPNSLPDCELHIKRDFCGLNATMVVRTLADCDFTLPELSERVVEHDLDPEEVAVYASLKSIISSMRKQLRQHKLENDQRMIRKFNAYLLGMITYTRQFLVCPLIPYATMAVEMTNMTHTNEMIEAFRSELNALDLTEWFKNPDASKSSRIRAVLNALDQHPSERVIVFTCFRVTLNVLAHYLPPSRDKYVISSKQSPAGRTRTLNEFAESANGILLLTYALGAEGLNLQHANVVLLADVWWNCSKTQQAIARVLRRGQMKPVQAYFFTSGTGIEKGLFTKHVDKLKCIRELAVGPLKTKPKTLKTSEILKLIDANENARILNDSLIM